jgi:hypothetical protein
MLRKLKNVFVTQNGGKRSLTRAPYLTLANSAEGELENRVTGCVREKIAKNGTQPVFLSRLIHDVHLGSKEP